MPTQPLDDERDTRGGSPTAQDAVELLRQDHEQVRQLFEDYESLLTDEADDEQRQDLAEHICSLLTVHAMIEEELLYPAAQEVLDSARLVDEALVEHATAKALIEQILEMSPADDSFDATVTVLGEYVRHHVEEEEEELFPQLAETELDLDDLGAQLAERRQELRQELGVTED